VRACVRTSGTYLHIGGVGEENRAGEPEFTNQRVLVTSSSGQHLMQKRLVQSASDDVDSLEGRRALMVVVNRLWSCAPTELTTPLQGADSRKREAAHSRAASAVPTRRLDVRVVRQRKGTGEPEQTSHSRGCSC